MHMLKGLTPAGIGEISGIKDYIEKASKYHFEAIDTDGESLEKWISAEGIKEANAFLLKHNVQIGAIGLSVDWRGSDENFKNGLERLAADAKAASSLGCSTCLTYILPSTDLNAAQFMAQAVRRLRVCAQLLGSFDIKLGLEFVGPHHLRTQWENPFIWSLEQTMDFIEAIGESNVGLLIDAYHCYTTDFSNDKLTELDVNKIVHVHINDAKDIPVEELLDNDRLYPGEGVIDLAGFLKALKKTGYKGVVSQEVLSKQPSNESSEVLLKKSAELYSKLFKQAELE